MIELATGFFESISLRGVLIGLGLFLVTFAVNLAHEVATGKKGVDEARKQYAESIEMLMKDNKMDNYTSSLIFTPPAKAGFADEPFGPMGTTAGSHPTELIRALAGIKSPAGDIPRNERTSRAPHAHEEAVWARQLIKESVT